MNGSGSVLQLPHRSEVLQSNPLGDPPERLVTVVLPPGYDENAGPYPAIFWLAGFGGRGTSMLSDLVVTEGLVARLHAAMRSGRLPEALVVLPDCTTRYGGSQYLDSDGTGKYLSYLVQEVVPFVDGAFPTVPLAASRAVVGKSSGGYGALMTAIRRPGVFGSVCCHTPDAGFEHCYLSLLPAALDVYRARGGFQSFAAAPQNVVPRDAAFMAALSLIAMGTCYAPRGSTGEGLPCDPDTGEFRDEVWAQWLRHDPVRLVPLAVAELRALNLLYFDVGVNDEYHMHWGVRALHAVLDRCGIPHVYQEHAGGHHGIEHRYDVMLDVLGRHWCAGARPGPPVSE